MLEILGMRDEDDETSLSPEDRIARLEKIAERAFSLQEQFINLEHLNKSLRHELDLSKQEAEEYRRGYDSEKAIADAKVKEIQVSKYNAELQLENNRYRTELLAKHGRDFQREIELLNLKIEKGEQRLQQALDNTLERTKEYNAQEDALRERFNMVREENDFFERENRKLGDIILKLHQNIAKLKTKKKSK